jgi:outer membrane protein OmpA-like peptidoglycan-associated protein
MKKSILFILMFIVLLLPATAQINYEVKKLPFSTRDFNEFAPIPYKNGVIFCSDKKSNPLVTYSDQANRTFTDIYFISRSGNSWSKAERFSPTLTTIFNDGPVTVASAGNKIYFTRNINTSIKQNSQKNLLGIYSAEWVENDWMNILPFQYNSNEYGAGHPSVSADGKELYFISNMPGGYGGTDIYMCKMQEGKWQQPENLGPSVNTAGDEMFPYVDRKGDLYFSSKTQSSGLDIFTTSKINGKWNAPRRLPEPINSGKDDFSFVTDDGGKQGYFASNRDGSDDVYEFILPIPDFLACDTLKKNTFCFEFFQDGIEYSDSLPLSYEWNLGDGTKVKALEVEHCFKNPGTYTIQLNVIDTVSGEVFYNEATYDLEVKEHEQVYIDSPDTLLTGQAASFDGAETNLPGFKPGSWFWDFGDGTVDGGITANHAFTHAGVYNVRLGTISTTDESGNTKKACVCKRVVVSDAPRNKSIAAQKITREIPKNSKAVLTPPVPLESVYKVEVANSKERISLEDTLFDKIEKEYPVQENYIPEKNEYSYTVGQEKSLSGTWPIYKEVKADGYKKATVKRYADDIVSLDKVGSLSKSEMNKKIVRINNALFDPGKYTLTKGAMHEMDKLYKLMVNNNELTVNISAHTDNEGSDQLNLELSEKRAMSIVEYLASKGIAKDRMQAKGYGESQPIADNGTAAGRKQNRRVEIKINWK